MVHFLKSVNDGLLFVRVKNKKWISIPVNDGKIYFPKRKILLGQYLYILGQRDNSSPENTVVKFKVFE